MCPRINRIRSLNRNNRRDKTSGSKRPSRVSTSPPPPKIKKKTFLFHSFKNGPCIFVTTRYLSRHVERERETIFELTQQFFNIPRYFLPLSLPKCCSCVLIYLNQMFVKSSVRNIRVPLSPSHTAA